MKEADYEISESKESNSRNYNSGSGNIDCNDGGCTGNSNGSYDNEFKHGFVRLGII